LKINDLMTLETAGKYSSPGDPGEILPVCVGDFLSPEVNSSDPEAGGTLPAVLIDVPTWTYCLNNGRSAVQTPEIYAEDVKQSASVYTIDVANNFQSQGLITTVSFGTDPGSRDISWRGKGLVDGTGALITNPITAIEHVFTTYGNWLLDEFDAATVNEARRRCEAHGLPIHWAFTKHETYRQWLTDIAGHYFMDVILTDQGRLALILDEGDLIDPARIKANLTAGVHVAGEAPENAVVWDLARRNLCNLLTVRSQYSWARGEFTAESTTTHAASKSLYASDQPKEALLPGIRTQAHLDYWSAFFFARYALLPALVKFPLKTTRYLAAMPSAYVTLDWRWGPEATGTGWEARTLKVLNTTVDFQAHETPLEAFDTGLRFEVSTYALLQDSSSATWYLSVGNDGVFLLTQSNPGITAVNQSTWSWIRLVSPDSTVSYVRPNTSGGSWLIASSQPGGTGTTAPVILVSRQAQRWRLAISNAPATVFFLREPQRLPFGGQTTQIAALGAFRLDFNVLA